MLRLGEQTLKQFGFFWSNRILVLSPGEEVLSRLATLLQINQKAFEDSTVAALISVLCKVHYKIQFLLLRSLEFYRIFYDYLIVIHVAMENPPLLYHK